MGTMPKFRGGGTTIDTSERSDDPGLLKARFGTICDLLDSFRVVTTDKNFEEVVEMCEAIYRGQDMCIIALKGIDKLEAMSEKSGLMDNIRDWRYCKMFGPLVFDKIPRNISPQKSFSGIESFSLCAESCLNQNQTFKAIFMNATWCGCFASYPMEWETCLSEKRCQGLMLNADSPLPGEFQKGMSLSLGDYVVGDVLDSALHKISLKSFETQWNEIIKASEVFFEENAFLTASETVKRSLEETIFEEGKRLCLADCLKVGGCHAFQIRPLMDWTDLRWSSDGTKEEITTECVLYGDGGLKYVVGQISLLGRLTEWVDQVPTAILFQN